MHRELQTKSKFKTLCERINTATKDMMLANLSDKEALDCFKSVVSDVYEPGRYSLDKEYDDIIYAVDFDLEEDGNVVVFSIRAIQEFDEVSYDEFEDELVSVIEDCFYN